MRGKEFRDRGLARSLCLVVPSSEQSNGAGRRNGETQRDESMAVAEKRKLVANLCRLIGDGLREPGTPTTRNLPQPVPGLSPRLRQTLVALLSGDAEKQIAARLRISRHTVHVYVKALYKRFEVTSRGELLARFVNRTSIEAAHVHLDTSPD
jgi:DNA-binding CsgD family transcriptional regulator